MAVRCQCVEPSVTAAHKMRLRTRSPSHHLHRWPTILNLLTPLQLELLLYIQPDLPLVYYLPYHWNQARKFRSKLKKTPVKAAAGNDTGVAAAAAALKKPKKKISTMTEVQIMEKLRQVVSEDDPKLLYEKVDEGELSLFAIFGANLFFSVDRTLWAFLFPLSCFRNGYCFFPVLLDTFTSPKC